MMVTICLQLVDIKGDISCLVALSSVHDVGDSKTLVFAQVGNRRDCDDGDDDDCSCWQ